MKECLQCKHSILFSDRSFFCTDCGARLTEVILEALFCPNHGCKRYTDEYRFVLGEKFCDYCGARLVPEGEIA